MTLDAQKKEQIRTEITRCLVDLGWTGLGHVALASKEFHTAVGPRTAHVYVAWFGDASHCMLQGDYLSEGRNQLEPHCTLIPSNAEPGEIARLTAQFALNADKVVSNTYAARLARPVVDPDAKPATPIRFADIPIGHDFTFPGSTMVFRRTQAVFATRVANPEGKSSGEEAIGYQFDPGALVVEAGEAPGTEALELDSEFEPAPRP